MKSARIKYDSKGVEMLAKETATSSRILREGKKSSGQVRPKDNIKDTSTQMSRQDSNVSLSNKSSNIATPRFI